MSEIPVTCLTKMQNVGHNNVLVLTTVVLWGRCLRIVKQLQRVDSLKTKTKINKGVLMLSNNFVSKVAWSLCMFVHFSLQIHTCAGRHARTLAPNLKIQTTPFLNDCFKWSHIRLQLIEGPMIKTWLIALPWPLGLHHHHRRQERGCWLPV